MDSHGGGLFDDAGALDRAPPGISRVFVRHAGHHVQEGLLTGDLVLHVHVIEEPADALVTLSTLDYISSSACRGLSLLPFIDGPGEPCQRILVIQMTQSF